jgi:hypothetical protein
VRSGYRSINANATPTFGIFVQGNGNVRFDPGMNRILSGSWMMAE